MLYEKEQEQKEVLSSQPPWFSICGAGMMYEME